MERKLFTVSNFSKGQLSSLAEEFIVKESALVAKNGYIDIDGSFKKRDRQEYIETIADSGEYIKNHCLYAKSDGTKYDILVAHSGSTSDAAKVYYKQRGTSGTFTRLTGFHADFGKNYDVSLLSFADVVWFTDGDTHAYTWDGTTLTAIWDGQAGELWDADFDDPLYMAEAQGAMYLAGYASDPAAIYHSVYYDTNGDFIRATSASAWNADQIVKIEDTGEVITGIHSFNKNLMIFTQNYVYLLSGYVAQVNPSLIRIYDNDGCISSKSIAIVNGKIMWVGQKGVYSFDGSSIKLESNGIKDYFEWMQYNSIMKYNLLLDDTDEYNKFDYLKNCDTVSITNNITSAMYPSLNYPEPTTFDWTSNNQTRYGLAQKIYVRRAIETDHLYIKFNYLTNASVDLYIGIATLSDGLDSYTYQTTQTMTGSTSPSPQEALVDIGAVSLSADTYYYITFHTSSTLPDDGYFNIENSKGSWNNSATSTYIKDTSTGSWTSVSKLYSTGLNVILMPENFEFYTDIYTITNAQSVGKLHIDYNSNYGSGTNTYYYRYSTVSEDALNDDDDDTSWTSITNDTSLSLTPGATIYIQFRCVFNNTIDDNNYWDDAARFYGLTLSYTTGTAISLELYGVEFDRRYFISIPTEGSGDNERVFVFDGAAWTYYNLHTLCMYVNDDILYYGLSDDNRLYRLTNEESTITDEWDTEDDWENYAQDSNCDDDTDTGSLQADYTADEIDDEFDGSSVDSKWTEDSFLPNTTASINDGKLRVYTTDTDEDDRDYWGMYIRCSDDSERATSYTLEGSMYLQGANGDDQTYIGIDLALGDDSSYDYEQNSINVRYDSANTRLLFYSVINTPSEDTQTDTVTGITACPDVVYLRVVYTWDATTPTVQTYYKIEDTGSWTLAFEKNATGYDINTMHVDRVKIIGYNSPFGGVDKYTEIGYITLTPDIEISSSIEYYDDAYRIYEYNSTGDLHIYWDGTNTSSQNTIKIYYASSRVLTDPVEDYTINDQYNWTLLGTITNTATTGDTTFTAPSYKYIKVVFDNPDATYSALLNEMYIISDEDVEMIWESGMLEMGKSDNEKYIRKAYIDAETDGGIDLYYRTEKMDDYRHMDLSATDKRVSLPAEHGKKIQYKIVSDNALPCKLKHFSIEYKERKLR